MQDNDFYAAGGSASRTQRDYTINAPQFESLEDRVMLDAAPVINWNQDDLFILDDTGGLTIGIDGFDADGDALDVTLSTTNGDAFGYLITDKDDGNRYAQLNFEDSDGNPIGSILVQLFEQRSPLATERFITLSTNYIDTVDGEKVAVPATVDDPAFYTDVVVHRIIQEFMFQSGDATNGTGSGGSGLDDYDYEGDDHLSFAGRGVLAAGHLEGDNDSNNSQFFITAAPYTYGDGDYSIFGQVISGWDVYQQIITEPTNTSDRPHELPVLTSVDIVNSDQDGALTIWAEDGFDGPTDVTITVTDSDGNTAEKTITIVRPEDLDDKPITQSIDSIAYEPGEIEPNVIAEIPFEIDYSADDDISVICWSKYSGDGEIITNIIDPAAEGEDYTLQLTLPAEYDGSTIVIYVSSKLSDYDNDAPSSSGFTVTLGTRPVIEDADTERMVADETRVTQMDITDDSDNITVEATTDQAGVVVDIDPDTHELTVTTPVDFYGVFTVTVTAIETEFLAFTGVAPQSIDIIYATLADKPVINPIANDIVFITLGNTDPDAPVTIQITDDLGEDLDVEAVTDFADVDPIGITDEDNDGIYEITITLDDGDFRGAFEITINVIEDVVGKDSLEPTSYTFTVTTLGERPVITNPDDDVYITGGQRYVINPEILDDTGIPLEVELDTDMSDVYIWLEEIADINGNVDHWEIIIDLRSLPVDYSGFFKVKLSAIEEDVDEGVDATENEFIVVAQPGFDPEIISIISPEDDATITHIEGDTLYIGTEGGLEIYDISDTTDPQLLGSFATTYDVIALELRGNIAYLAESPGFGGTLHILDLTDPADIKTWATIKTTSYRPISGLKLSDDGNTAYLTNLYSGFSIYDISSVDGTADEPVEESDLPDPIYYTKIDDQALGSVNDLLLYENNGETILYLMVNQKLLVIDASDAENLELIKSIKTNIRTFDHYDQNGHKVYTVIDDNSGTPSMAVIQDDVLYVSDSTTGLWTYDITDPRAPKKLDWIGWPGTYLTVQDNVAVISEGGFHRFLDVSDPENINVTQRTYAPGWVGRASLSGDLMVLPYGSEGVALMDMSNLTDMTTYTKTETFVAPDDTEIKFKLSGSGLIRLHTNDDGELTSVDITGTTIKSSLSITASENYDFCDLTVYSDIKTIAFKNITIVSDITINGAVKKISMEDVQGQAPNEATLTITGSPTYSLQPLVSIYADDIQNFHIDSSVPIDKLYVDLWIDSNTDNFDSIIAPSIKKLKVDSHLRADIQLNNDGDSPYVKVLGSASIGGLIMGGDWSIAGEVGKVTTANGVWDDYDQNLDIRDTMVFTSRSFTLDNGKEFTVKITGGGYVLVSPGNTAGVDIESIEIVNATANSKVTIVCKDDDLVIGSLSSDSSLKRVQVKGAAITGDINIFGDISQLFLADIGSGDRVEQTITITGDYVTGGDVDIRLGDVTDLRINSELAIRYLLVNSWLDDETDIDDNTIETDKVKAPYIAKLVSKGDFAASLDVNTDESDTSNIVMKKAVIYGDVSEAVWDINGHVNSAVFKGSLSGDITANSITKMTVSENMDTANLTLKETADNYQKVFALNTLSIRGSVIDSRILTAGNIKVISVGAITGSDIYAGYLADDPDEVTALPTEAQIEEDDPYIFDTDAIIKKFKVNGLKVAGAYIDSFADSSVTASTISKVYVKYAETDPAADNFGIAARELTYLSYKDLDKTNNVKLKSPISADHTVLDNFIVRIV